jgi:hypothetical protein
MADNAIWGTDYIEFFRDGLEVAAYRRKDGVEVEEVNAEELLAEARPAGEAE